jgi:hypothetical protein
VPVSMTPKLCERDGEEADRHGKIFPSAGVHNVLATAPAVSYVASRCASKDRDEEPSTRPLPWSGDT